VRPGAGTAAAITDAAYEAGGAEITDRAGAFGLLRRHFLKGMGPERLQPRAGSMPSPTASAPVRADDRCRLGATFEEDT
jgi:hypothetical protein